MNKYRVLMEQHARTVDSVLMESVIELTQIMYKYKMAAMKKPLLRISELGKFNSEVGIALSDESLKFKNIKNVLATSPFICDECASEMSNDAEPNDKSISAKDIPDMFIETLEEVLKDLKTERGES